ncbi:MAG: nicotinate-nucleotide pyrophosphorylase (carboxylating) [Acidimicrobiales bacterium]|jgi:nicotinate-nucleotide pyrophosphorylase (carboxylating)|nr:nicotinate-nucleotide pyrophosphorylase (carboxylating) [Acidimicrobiales bacterium]
MNDVEAPLHAIREVVARALAEDLTPLGDITAALLPLDSDVIARLVPRQDGVLAGRRCADESFAQVDTDTKVSWAADDGQEVSTGDVIATVTGRLSSVLTAERTALNLLGHLSGVATLTRRYVRATHGQARIRDTRKTTPGLRSLEKAAVRAGGGVNHRGNLSDGILLKDNHLAGIGIGEAVRRARLRWPGRTVEVECDTIDQVRQALDAAADLVLLDNMSPAEVADAVGLVGKALLVEVSGGVTLDSVRAYAEAGADLISVGAITHSAPILDIGLDL